MIFPDGFLLILHFLILFLLFKIFNIIAICNRLNCKESAQNAIGIIACFLVFMFY